jgi:SRSO17 transposase
VTDPAARALLKRLGSFLDRFNGCFGRRSHRRYASRYIQGLLNDSERKSMQPMHGRLSDPGSYQGLQHFITHSRWEARRFWQRLRSLLPVRHGVLAIDDTGLPKQGKLSVGVQRQYCGALGKVANCQVAVSTALIADGMAWPTSLELYLPEDWATDQFRRDSAGIPTTLGFREKWRIALAHVRTVMHAGITLEAVVADSAYGQIATFRTGLERLGLLYVLAVPSHLSARVTADTPLESVATIATGLAPSMWHQITWAQGTKGPLVARFAAVRVRPTKSRGERWLLCEESLTDGERTYYFSNGPPTMSLRALVKLARGRWAVEIQYRDLKSELGFDHFEGRSYPGWNHHAVLAAITYTFLQLERRRRTNPLPTFPEVRNLVRELMVTLFFAERPQSLKLVLSFQRNPPLRI